MVFDDFWNILWIPILLFPLLFLYFKRRRRGEILFSTLAFLKEIPHKGSFFKRHFLLFLRVCALFLLIVAFMRPREGLEKTKVRTEGVDIVLALDVSGSMRAEDFSIGGKARSRLYVVKEVVREFIQKRKNDRVGVVIFGGRAYTLCPLTLDQGILSQFLERVDFDMVEDGTAIGEGLATSLNRLRATKAKSKLIVLLTDGVHNAGKVDPKTAAELAKTMGVKLYTIGVGSRGPVPFPNKVLGRTVYQMVRIDLDEDLLREMAQKGGGQYYRATDTPRLQEIYRLIDELEKTEITSDVYVQYQEKFSVFVWCALALVLFEIVLSQTHLRVLP